MWPGEQPPGGGQNPQQPTPGTPNPYQQPGVPYPNPPQQPGGHRYPTAGPQGPAPWNAPTQPGGPLPPAQPPGGSGRGSTRLIVAGAAVLAVAAAAVGAFLFLGGDEDNGDKEAAPGPSGSASASPTGNPREGGGLKPTVAGWQTVADTGRGMAFDVPAEWNIKARSWVSWVEDESDPDLKPLIGVSGPAFLKEKWCSSDEDRDGTKSDTALATTGSRSNKGARSTREAAVDDARKWVYGGYAQPRREAVKAGTAEEYTTTSGLKGTVATASSSGAPDTDKCDSEGKATVFSFENADGQITSWAFFGASEVKDEVPDATIRKILSTVRLVEGDGKTS